MSADDIKALIARLRDGTNTSWEQTFLDCREAAGTLESLLQQRNIALLDAERAREERNSVHVRLNAEWLLKLKKLDEENTRLRLEFREDCEKQAEELFAIARKLEIATQELKNIANADTVEWDDPTQYEAWAKSRARWALEQIEKEPT